MSFTDELWQGIVAIRQAIEDLDFLRGLGEGTLSRERFDYYMRQDAGYLGTYARALAGLASMASDPDDLVFWAGCARDSILVERSLHASHVEVDGPLGVSPTSRAYQSFLLACLASGEYAVAASAVLPCFWIYQSVGDSLLEKAGELENHAYGDWIGMYADPAFAEQTMIVRSIVDRLAEQVSEETRGRMREAFETACRYEWMFWDAAWRMEAWPI